MEARKALVSQAIRNAYRLALKGQYGGTILDGQACDPTDLLTSAGFPSVSYNSTTGDVHAVWPNSTVPPVSKLVTDLVRIVQMGKEARRAEILVEVWPVLVNAVNSRARVDDPLTLTFKCQPMTPGDIYSPPKKLPPEGLLREVLTECGIVVDKITTHAGDYHDESMGGWWKSFPSMDVECHFEASC